MKPKTNFRAAVRRCGALILSLMTTAVCLHAQPSGPRFGYDEIRRGVFAPKSVSGVRSMRDGEHYTTLDEGRILKFSYRTGEQEAVVFDASAAEPSLRFTNYVFSSDERRILLTTDVKPIYRHSFTADYWLYDIPSGELRRLSEGGPQQEASFSPDGSRVEIGRAHV